MPLYKMEKGFTYDGVTISRQNMTNWIIYSTNLETMNGEASKRGYELQCRFT